MAPHAEKGVRPRFCVGNGVRPRFWGLWLAAAVAAGQAPPAVVEVEARVDPPQAVIGDVVTYSATAVVPSEVADRVDEQAPVFTGFEVLDTAPPTLERGRDETVYTWRLRLRPQAVGELIVAPFQVGYYDRRDRHYHRAASAKCLVRVTVEPTLADLRPARDVVPVPDFFGPYRTALALLVSAGFLAVATALVAWVAHRAAHRPPPVDPASLPPPLEVETLARLGELAGQDLPRRGEDERYHVGLSQIVRDYLGRRFRFNAVESTTTEIGARLEDRGLHDNVVILCRRVLSGCDRDKFAGYQPSVEEMEELMRQARALVTLTSEPGRRR